MCSDVFVLQPTGFFRISANSFPPRLSFLPGLLLLPASSVTRLQSPLVELSYHSASRNLREDGALFFFFWPLQCDPLHMVTPLCRRMVSENVAFMWNKYSGLPRDSRWCCTWREEHLPEEEHTPFVFYGSCCISRGWVLFVWVRLRLASEGSGWRLATLSIQVLWR